ncbi:MAG TPA: response regulator [Candidatus Angelobacter sp.]|nr:response regulator [Candidatus Angelobacter sp.]
MKRILLVDDDRDIVKSTAQLLQAFGYDVTVCVDADRVIETMHSHRPDVVLHDVRMPGLDLRAQVRAIRDDPDITRVPIVLFTAVLSAKELAVEVGADDAIEKPFDTETLRRVLRDCETRRTGLRSREEQA